VNPKKSSEEEEKEKEKEEKEEGKNDKPSMQGWRVLIADDSDMNTKLLTRKFSAGPFKELGWQIETATTGEEALEMIEASRRSGGDEGSGEAETNRRSKFDIVVFDEHMEPFGKLLGTEATRILREKDSEVLIVGFTGNCAVEDQERSKESGQDLFWSKPAPPSEAALTAIEKALAERRGRNKKKEKGEGKWKGLNGGEGGGGGEENVPTVRGRSSRIVPSG